MNVSRIMREKRPNQNTYSFFFNDRKNSIKNVFLAIFFSLFFFSFSGMSAAENIKDMTRYSSNQVFIISDASWQNVFSLVPVTTWSKSAEQSSKTSSNAEYTYPTLIFYEEKSHKEYRDFSSIWDGPNEQVVVTASSFADNNTQPRNLADDSLLSEWNSGSCNSTSWLKVDLGRAIPIDYIRLYPNVISGYDIRIQISSDGQNNNTIFDDHIEIRDIISGFNFTRQDVRYITITIFNQFNTGNQAYEWSAFTEIEVYDTQQYTEKKGFDADAVIHFLQMYRAQRATVIGEKPSFFNDLLTAQQDYGAGLRQDQIENINMTNLLSYWSSYDTVVYVEEDYSLAMLASIYASLHNAPLVIDNTNVYPRNVFEGKTVIVVGKLNCPQSAANCIIIKNIDDLSAKYSEETNTRKIILVNPLDLNISLNLFKPFFTPAKGGMPIAYGYSKQSLSAPILAAAKKELIVFSNVQPTDALTETKPLTCNSPILNSGMQTRNAVKNANEAYLNNKLEYLTIIASPQAIPDAAPLADEDLVGLDFNYGFFPPHSFASIGRIYSLTPSDVSSYIARSIFYDNLKSKIYSNNDPPSKTALIRAISSVTGSQPLGMDHIFLGFTNAVNLVRSNFNVKCYFDIESFNPTCDYLILPPLSAYIHKQIYNYWDHGSSHGHAGFTSDSLTKLDLTWIFSNACSTNTFSLGRQGTFGPRVLRSGAMVHFGSEGISYSSGFSATKLANQNLANNDPLGVINRKLYSDYTYRESYSMIGDPTLQMNLNFNYPSACNDNIDNDGDNQIDFGQDSGCQGRLANTESGLAAECSDNWDNDGDYFTDYPSDPDCISIYDNSENQNSKTQCQDGIDNDNDGQTDMNDQQCYSVFQNDEGSISLSCIDGIDNNGDGLIDLGYDLGCGDIFSTEKSFICYDGIDNNNNGYVDKFDISCLYGGNEQAIAQPECSDCLDNDGDGLTDYPVDPGCDSLNDNSEEVQCNDGIDNDRNGLTDLVDPKCHTETDISEFPECNNGMDENRNGLKDYSTVPMRSKDYSSCLSVSDDEEVEENQCNDGLDNDDDGTFDFVGDLGCFNEFDPSELSECNDDIDNDGDRLTDYPNDPGCSYEQDHSEYFDCRDGLDNDGDGAADYPEDTGCENLDDRSENKQCSDGLDNDNDGLIDYPEDIHCLSSDDNTEGPECNDNFDNDNDAFKDYFATPMTKRDYAGCISVDDNDESHSNECNDGIDNDNDGFSDYPADFGCFNEFDPSELSECNDNIDNDGDGNIDYPEELGCNSPEDHTELLDCNDGLDNDFDNLTDYREMPNQPDLNDPVNNSGNEYGGDAGCDDENDQSEQYQCSDGIDNDNDGFIDMTDLECGSFSDNKEASDCSDNVSNDQDGYSDAEDPGCVVPFERDDNETNPSIERKSFFSVHINDSFTVLDREIQVIDMNQISGGSMYLLVNGGIVINSTVNLTDTNRSAVVDGIYLEAVRFGDASSDNNYGLIFVKLENESYVYLLKLIDSPKVIYDENVSVAFVFPDRTGSLFFQMLDGNTDLKQLQPGVSIRRTASSYDYIIGNVDSFYSILPNQYMAVRVI